MLFFLLALVTFRLFCLSSFLLILNDWFFSLHGAFFSFLNDRLLLSTVGILGNRDNLFTLFNFSHFFGLFGFKLVFLEFCALLVPMSLLSFFLAAL